MFSQNGKNSKLSLFHMVRQSGKIHTYLFIISFAGKWCLKFLVCVATVHSLKKHRKLAKRHALKEFTEHIYRCRSTTRFPRLMGWRIVMCTTATKRSGLLSWSWNTLGYPCTNAHSAQWGEFTEQKSGILWGHLEI